MKIDRLYTLSQFIDFAKEIDDLQIDISPNLRLEKIIKYNDFLKQPLTRDMFVNETPKPEEIKEKENTKINQAVQCKYWNKEYERWKEAEKKVIFEGWSKRMWNGGVLFDNDLLDIFIDISEHKTLSELAYATNGELKLKNVEL